MRENSRSSGRGYNLSTQPETIILRSNSSKQLFSDDSRIRGQFCVAPGGTSSEEKLYSGGSLEERYRQASTMVPGGICDRINSFPCSAVNLASQTSQARSSSKERKIRSPGESLSSKGRSRTGSRGKSRGEAESHLPEKEFILPGGGGYYTRVGREPGKSDSLHRLKQSLTKVAGMEDKLLGDSLGRLADKASLEADFLALAERFEALGARHKEELEEEKRIQAELREELRRREQANREMEIGLEQADCRLKGHLEDKERLKEELKQALKEKGVGAVKLENRDKVVQDIQSANAQLAEQLSALEAELSTGCTKLIAIEREKERVTREGLERERGLQKELERAREENRNQEARNRALEASSLENVKSLAFMEAKIEGLEDRVREMAQQNEEKDIVYRNLERKTQETNKKNCEERNIIEEKYQKQLECLKNETHEREGLEMEIDRLKRDLKDMKTRNKSLEDEAKDLHSAKHRLESLLVTSEENLRIKSAEISSNKQSLLSQSTEMASLEANLANEKERLKIKQKQIQDLKEDIKDRDSHIESLKRGEKLQESLAAQVRELEQENMMVKSNLTQSLKETHTLKSDNKILEETLQKERESNNDICSKYRETVSKIGSIQNGLRQEGSKLLTKTTTLENQLAESQANLERKERENRQLFEELQECKDLIGHYLQERVKLLHEVTKVEQVAKQRLQEGFRKESDNEGLLIKIEGLRGELMARDSR